MGKFFLNLHSFLDLSHTDRKGYPIHLHRTTHTSTHFAGNKDSIPFGKGKDWKAGKLERFLNRDSWWNLKTLAIEVNGDDFP